MLDPRLLKEVGDLEDIDSFSICVLVVCQFSIVIALFLIKLITKLNEKYLLYQKAKIL